MREALKIKLLAIKHKHTSPRETSKQNCNILYTVMGSSPPEGFKNLNHGSGENTTLRD